MQSGAGRLRQRRPLGGNQTRSDWEAEGIHYETHMVSAGDLLFDAARAAFEELVEGGDRRPQAVIVPAAFGARAGAIGAALGARQGGLG